MESAPPAAGPLTHRPGDGSLAGGALSLLVVLHCPALLFSALVFAATVARLADVLLFFLSLFVCWAAAGNATNPISDGAQRKLGRRDRSTQKQEAGWQNARGSDRTDIDMARVVAVVVVVVFFVVIVVVWAPRGLLTALAGRSDRIGCR